MPDASILFNPEFSVVDESADWIVVDKPSHLLSHPNKPGNPPTLLDGLEGLLGFEIVNGARLSVITRLDRDTSGLVLVAKNPETARELSFAIQNAEIGKEYLAIVSGWPAENDWTVDAALRRRGEFEETPIWLKRAVHPDGKPCRTRFAVETRFERTEGQFALVRCFPETGRMHQIRVHLAHSGFPIVGDRIYGPDERCYLEFIETGWTSSLAQQLLIDRHALHATKLTWREHVWNSPLPADLAEFCESSP
ncbi:MAG: 23S rRNA pseudouridine1911/1915/1917 synthase [Verrucomicrobiales bacterium]